MTCVTTMSGGGRWIDLICRLVDTPRFKCGSWLACEEGLTGNQNVESACSSAQEEGGTLETRCAGKRRNVHKVVSIAASAHSAMPINIGAGVWSAKIPTKVIATAAVTIWIAPSSADAEPATAP